MKPDKIDTSTPEGFALRLEREYGVTIIRNRKTMDADSPDWWEIVPMGGMAQLGGGTDEVIFTYDAEKIESVDLLNYGLCHEVGHILDCREIGLDLYAWRYQVEMLEIEESAWERADQIFFSIRGRVSTEAAKLMADFRLRCLNSYASGTATPEHEAKVRDLLERGTLLTFPRRRGRGRVSGSPFAAIAQR